MTVTAPRVQLRYGDKVLDSGSGGVHRHLNPYTGELQAEVPLAGQAEVDEAVELAAAQAEAWRRWAPERRRDVLTRFAGLLEEHRAEFAALQALDGGTPTHFGERIIDNSVNWTRYYAGWCDKLSGELISTLDTRGYFSYTAPEPYGVIGAIVTWNGPVVSLGMKVIPALAAGNCVVTKPSEFTPFAPDLYGRLLREAGVPAGVCSILAGGPEAGAALVRNPKVEKVSFTGGPAAARQIAHACAEQLKPAVLELGGKTGSIVFPDAGDLRDGRRACGQGQHRGAGRAGLRGAHQAHRARGHLRRDGRAGHRGRRVLQGRRPVRPRGQGGTADQRGRGGARLRDARPGPAGQRRADRARRRAGRRRPRGQELRRAHGHRRRRPAARDRADRGLRPGAALFRFSTEDEAVELANSTPYGLGANIQSTSLTLVHRLAERLKAGGVYVNGARQNLPHTPFGGLGISGYGKEGGRAGIDEFLRYKTVSIIEPQ